MKKECFKGPFYSKQGFTLIELLVVVLIIGILAAVAVPQYQRAVKKARFTHLQSMCKALADAEELYYLTNGEYTVQIEELGIELPTGYAEQGFQVELTNAYVVCKHNDVNNQPDLARFMITYQKGESRYEPAGRYCYSTDANDIFCKKISVTGLPVSGTSHVYRLP